MKTSLLAIFFVGLYKAEGWVVPEEPAPCELTLQKDGNIVQDGETVVGLSGDLNQVYCKALCSGPGPTPALRWTKQDGTRIPMFRNRVYQVETTFDRTNILTIRNMLYIDQGNYTCRGWLRHSGWVSKSLNIQYGCPQLYHMCDTSRCMSNKLVCDGKADCDDETDEKECESCFPGQFACDGGCKDGSVRCDGFYDCVDSSDEYLCGCEPELTCSRSGGCVAKDHVCDGTDDCWPYGEDESNCTYCNEREFHCGGAECVPQTSVCNGANDCSNGMDENECPFKVVMTGSRLEVTEGMLAAFECNVSPFLKQRNYEFTWSRQDGELPAIVEISGEGGTSVLTMPQTTVSDAGTYVCEVTDGKTTESATGELIVTERCPNSFGCLNGTCISVTYLCDGFLDCGLGEDEENCDADCQSGEFDCGDGQCIPEEQKCDGSNQCTSGADEAGCCSDGFLCWDGECIDDGSVCDGINDCDLGEDETNCTCADDEFQCDSGECIPDTQRCDLTPQCSDGSDERDCDCADDEFQCDSWECIPDTGLCDSTPQCSDGSDERDCGCQDSEFQCEDFSCINPTRKCDGTEDCASGEDENDCPTTCMTDEFSCNDGTCIPLQWRCNKVKDCSGGEDECGCVPEEFKCNDGMCISNSTVCDSAPDCAGAEDEADCGHEICPEGRMRCPDGSMCIDTMQICDGTQDCDDNWDETAYCMPPAQ